MKLIIICGQDRIGKNSLIKTLCEHFEFDNITVRHCSKPPKGESFEFQKTAFYNEADLIKMIDLNDKRYEKYYENIVIYNRFYLGEYVWGSLYRNTPKETILQYIKDFEKYDLGSYDTYLVYLYADAEFACKREDGKSFSNTVTQKQNELNLFNEVIEASSIKKKIKIKVNNGSEFISKHKIFKTTLDFINNTK